MTDKRVSATRALTLMAALIVAACATQPLPPEPRAQPPQAPVIPAPTPPEPIGPDPAEIRLSIAAVGDMMIGTDFPDNRLPDDDGVSFLSTVTPVLSAADIAFGNIEGVLLDGGEPAKKCSNPKACYLFRSPTRYAAHFAAAGFDVVSFANNHARDFGEEGRTSSMQAVAQHGMHHSGRVGDVASWLTKDLRIAMIAFAVTKNSNMMLDVVPAALQVGQLAVDHDIVIVSFHGGAEGLDAQHVPFAPEEYYQEPRGDVVVFARAMVDAGADLLLGHGPHVVRAMERYKERLIAYSLGNFATYYGISVNGLKGVAPILTITVDGNGKFIDGKIDSTIQRRPAGPSIDSGGRALRKIRELSMADFVEPGLIFEADGGLLPTERSYLRTHGDCVNDGNPPQTADC